MHPWWDEYFGSGGRAATALAALGIPVTLCGYADANARASFEARAALAGVDLTLTDTPQTPCFRYTYGLAEPEISNYERTDPIRVDAESVVQFGMLEGGGVVHAQRVVYDPQSACDPRPFHENGSSAQQLAMVLNRREAGHLLGHSSEDAVEAAAALAEANQAEVVILKCGAAGAVVFANGNVTTVPAYVSPRVWKIGSGDQFTAQFAAGWLHLRLTPHDAADRASRATAFYCNGDGFPTLEALAQFKPTPIKVGERWRSGARPMVYLAGPFFNLAQLWLVEQARSALTGMGLRVFSPYHDVGRGSADDVCKPDLEGLRKCAAVLALADGHDPGTLFEIGFARALDLPVVVYAESESTEDCKMLKGSGCHLAKDFVSAVYHAAWAAIHE